MRTHPHVANVRRGEACDVYVGRGSPWGNPWTHQRGTRAAFVVATRGQAIAAYARWIQTQPQLLELLPQLRGKVLGCWCAPLPCHAEVLAAMANGTPMPALAAMEQP